MAFIVSQNQKNMSFLTYSFPQATLSKGQASTITNIAQGIVRGMSDTFERSNQIAQLQSAFPKLQSNGLAAFGSTIRRDIAPEQLQPMQQEIKVVEMEDLRYVRSGHGKSNSSLSVDVSVDVSVGSGSGSTGSTGDDALDAQIATNMKQAQQIKNQLRLDNRTDWGVDSVAQDLAVFGLDFSSMSGDSAGLWQTLQDKAQEMLEALASGDAKGDTTAQRNRITGALSRLTTGLAGASMGAAADWSVSADVSTTVNVGGTDIDAGFVIDVGNVIVDPLTLDLEGDGLNLRGVEEGVDFDMDGDGASTRMGFIQGDDALLFEDTHGDGMVHDGRQLFGNTDGHANGFEKLRTYDDNRDGVIDKNDAVYDSLRLWVEKTVDGVSGAGETMSLEEAGIASINVGYENVREDDGTGNLIGQKGGFTRDDGTQGLAADVWFQERK